MSTATINGSPLRALSPAERKAVDMRQRGASEAAIRIETNLTADLVDVAVNRAAEWEKLGAKTNPPTAPGPEGRRTANSVLAWAEGSGITRAMTLAARIREHLAELRSLQEKNEARTQAQAEVDRLTAELEAARTKLRDASVAKRPGGPSRPAGVQPDPERRERLAAIRAWAPGAGFELSALGRIPKHIEDAYDAAHPAQEEEA